MVDFSFYRYERQLVAFLVFWLFYSYAPAPAPLPTADAEGVLARFEDTTEVGGVARPFFFGLATAPAHVEDQLDDGWLEFGRAGKVAAFQNQGFPELRNNFWTKPETELDIAASAGVQLFRLGVDWGRVMPAAPDAEGEFTPDAAAVARYREILQMVRARKMTVMLTLFHHSMPKWAAAYGGWTHPRCVQHFALFAELVVAQLGDLVDYWVPFNEPTVFVGLTYCAGAWPPGFPEPGPLTSGVCMMAPVIGNYSRAMAHVALGHRAAARAIRAKYATPIGAAHNIAYMSPSGAFDLLPALLSDRLMTMPFLESIGNAIDFVGLNYYGQEFMAGVGKIAVLSEEEYSDSGRAVYPDGLYHMLKAFHKRFRTLPIIITENGVADDRDVLRPAYIAEHLLAVAAARAEGVPVAGYVFWTVADNWEWADGYCPKFGLAAVDRGSRELRRVLRPASFELFKAVATTKRLTAAQADAAWAPLAAAAAAGANRSFCRALEGTTGMTGFSGLDEPVQRPLVRKDWRLGRWRPPAYVDIVSRALRAARGRVLDAVAAAAGTDAAALTARWEELKAQASSPAARDKAMADSKRWLGDALAPGGRPGAPPAPAAAARAEELSDEL